MLTGLAKHLVRSNIKMVILIRSDIKMGKGKIASQAAHAAVSLYSMSLKNKNPFLQLWLDAGQPKIILKVNRDANETLDVVYKDARKADLIACKIFDAGKTQIAPQSLTAVGIGPCKEDDVDKITKAFNLL